MTPFEYVTVLISIVLGLGLTQLLSGVAEMIHHWNRVRLYWPHLLWVLLAFFLHVQEWWELYALRDMDAWRLPVFFVTILYPVNLFILARILFPAIAEDKPVVSFKDFYFQHYRKFFLLIIVLAVVSAVDDLILSGLQLSNIIVEFSLALILGILAAFRVDREWIHQAVVTLLTLFVIIYLIVAWNRLILG